MGLHEGAHYSLLKKVAKNVNEIANDNSLLGKVAKNVNDISHDYFGGKIANKCQRDLGLHMLLFIKIAKNVNEIWGCTRFFRKNRKECQRDLGSSCKPQEGHSINKTPQTGIWEARFEHESK